MRLLGDGLDRHVPQQAQRIAFQSAAEAAERASEADRRLADQAALATAQARHGQPQFNRLAADGHGADGTVLAAVADHVGGLAARAAVVLGILLEVQSENAVLGGRLRTTILAKTKGAIK